MAGTGDIVLVTGGSGYVSSSCIKRLLDDGYRVRATVRSLSDASKTDALKKLSPPQPESGGGDTNRLELIECDLLDASVWPAACQGCRFVMHVASPLPTGPVDRDLVVRTAVDGTLNVLRAARDAGVERVVYTGAGLSIFDCFAVEPPPTVIEEDQWADLDDGRAHTPYVESKVKAEKAAWAFVEKCDKMELAVVSPVAVLGPIRNVGGPSASELVVVGLLNGQMAFLPDFRMSICDVDDVAKAHSLALTSKEAAGRRMIVAAGSMSVREIAEQLESEYGRYGYRIPRRSAPRILFSVLSLFNAHVKMLMPTWAKPCQWSDKNRKEALGDWELITPQSSVSRMAEATIAAGHVETTSAYAEELEKKKGGEKAAIPPQE